MKSRYDSSTNTNNIYRITKLDRLLYGQTKNDGVTASEQQSTNYQSTTDQVSNLPLEQQKKLPFYKVNMVKIANTNEKREIQEMQRAETDKLMNLFKKMEESGGYAQGMREDELLELELN